VISDSKTNGGSIRAARKAARLSQEQLARRGDCSTAYVRLLEGGYAPSHSDVLPRLLQALNDAELEAK